MEVPAARDPGTLRPGAWPSSEAFPASFYKVVPPARLSPLTMCGQQEAGLPAALAREPVPPLSLPPPPMAMVLDSQSALSHCRDGPLACVSLLCVRCCHSALCELTNSVLPSAF